MIVLAVLLLLLVAAVVLFVAVTGSTETVDLVWDAVGFAWAPTALAVLLLGAAVMLAAEAAVGLLLRGSRRMGHRRQELKRLRRLESRQGENDTGPAAAIPTTPAAPMPEAPPPPASGPLAADPGPVTAETPTGGLRRSGRRAAR